MDLHVRASESLTVDAPRERGARRAWLQSALALMAGLLLCGACGREPSGGSGAEETRDSGGDRDESADATTPGHRRDGGERTDAKTAANDDAASTGPSDGPAGLGGDARANGREVVQIDVSYSTTCARISDGAVRCWGKGFDARLGYGNLDDVGYSKSIRAAGDVDVGGPVVHISNGDLHTCALLGTGGVRCWGQAGAGQLGYGNLSTIGDDEPPSQAGDVPVGAKASAIATGQAHTCAILASGDVRCWGSNGYGELGVGNKVYVGAAQPASSGKNVLLGGVSISQIDACDFRTCAITQRGALRCWGANTSGELGYGHTNHIGDDESPDTAGDVPLGGVAKQVSVGGLHVCALLVGGTVRCWGSNASGQLGYGRSVGPAAKPADLGDVDVGGEVVSISAGRLHTCAVLADGALRCWGDNHVGQLGYGHTRTIGLQDTPGKHGPIDVGGPVKQVAAGMQHTCALLLDGTVRCWGFNGNGELGIGGRLKLGDDETPASVPPVDVL